MAEHVDRYHLTRTPNWINRRQLPSTKPVGDGYYEFSIREVLSMAMAFRR